MFGFNGILFVFIMNDILEALKDISSRLWIIEYEQLADIVDICQNLSLSLDDSINELMELEVTE